MTKITNEGKKYTHVFSFINHWYTQFIINSDNDIITSNEWNILITREFWENNKGWILLNQLLIKNK